LIMDLDIRHDLCRVL